MAARESLERIGAENSVNNRAPEIYHSTQLENWVSFDRNLLAVHSYGVERSYKKLSLSQLAWL